MANIINSIDFNGDSYGIAPVEIQRKSSLENGSGFGLNNIGCAYANTIYNLTTPSNTQINIPSKGWCHFFIEPTSSQNAGFYIYVYNVNVNESALQQLTPAGYLYRETEIQANKLYEIDALDGVYISKKIQTS